MNPPPRGHPKRACWTGPSPLRVPSGRRVVSVVAHGFQSWGRRSRLRSPARPASARPARAARAAEAAAHHPRPHVGVLLLLRGGQDFVDLRVVLGLELLHLSPPVVLDRLDLVLLVR